VFKPGDRVGSFEVLTRLRAGGMATLYLANRHGARGFVRPVAIKVIHPHLAEDGTLREMFADEAHLASRIQHPNVVHVEEFGECNGTYYLAMEYIHGASLAQLLRALASRRERLAPSLAVAIALHVADGLHAAHELRDAGGTPLEVVHRDVSPQNVLLSHSGHVTLIDFGVAKAIGRARVSHAGLVRGKLSYMPPEQARGEPVDRRADVYALAVVLWEMLTMRLMFDAFDDLALLRQVLEPDVPPLATLEPALSPALCAAVESALAPRREDRPASAKEFRRRLAAALPDALAHDDADLAAVMRAAMTHELAAADRVLTAACTPNGATAPEAAHGTDADAHATAGHASAMAAAVATVATAEFDRYAAFEIGRASCRERVS
jgi:serine/threonine-protein kinase